MNNHGEPAIPFAHPVYVRRILDCLNSRGVRPTDVLQGAGLAWQEVCDGQRMVDFAVFRRFVAQAIQASGEPALGLMAGSMLQPYHSPVGIAAVTSETLGQSLQSVCRHAGLIFGSVDFQLEEGPRWTILKAKAQRPMCETQVFVTQSIVGAHCRLFETILGRPVDELVVGLPYARPAGNDVPCLRYVRRVEFDQPCLSFQLPSELLAARCMGADAVAFAEAARACRKLESERHQGEFVQQVRDALLARLNANPDLAELAAALDTTPRALARRLADVGVTYSDLKDELRKTHAAWYLQHTELSMEAIASQLGYPDPTNFSRKFKCWYRLPPSKMRQALRRGHH